MIPFLFLAAVSADLDALDQAVAHCDRGFANPAFSAEAGRRSSFLLETYREQESIVAARLDVSQRRATLREAGAIKAADDKKLSSKRRRSRIARRRSTTSACSKAFDRMRWIRCAAFFS